MDAEQWEAYKIRSRTWAIRLGYDLLHSKAYRAMDYGPAIKLLNWFYEKVRLKVDKKKRGGKRFVLIDGEDISFSYAEGERRGLSHHQFSKALQELHRFGFIDQKRPGSRLKGDWTAYAISERWREFGIPSFKEIPWRKSVLWRNFGFGSQEKRSKKRGKRNLLSANSRTIVSANSNTIEKAV